ncbi:MAG: hypothetical protein JW966_12580 [Anaerolineae bacterium]|nr:hypothetical protein [Anaerolineae bacterium]
MNQAAAFGAILLIFVGILVVVMSMTNRSSKGKKRPSRAEPQNNPAASALPMQTDESGQPYYYDWEDEGSTSYSLSLHRFDASGDFIGKECDVCCEVKWLGDFFLHGTSHDKRTNTCKACSDRLAVERLEHRIRTLQAEIEACRHDPTLCDEGLVQELARLEQELAQTEQQLWHLLGPAEYPDAWSLQWREYYRRRKEAGLPYIVTARDQRT